MFHVLSNVCKESHGEEFDICHDVGYHLPWRWVGDGTGCLVRRPGSLREGPSRLRLLDGCWTVGGGYNHLAGDVLTT